MRHGTQLISNHHSKTTLRRGQGLGVIDGRVHVVDEIAGHQLLIGEGQNTSGIASRPKRAGSELTGSVRRNGNNVIINQ